MFQIPFLNEMFKDFFFFFEFQTTDQYFFCRHAYVFLNNISMSTKKVLYVV